MSLASDDRLDFGRCPFWEVIIVDLSGRVAEGPKESSCTPSEIIMSLSPQ